MQLPTLPVFYKLRGRRVLMAGGGEPALWKAEVLCAAGGHVDVVAEIVCDDLRALAQRLGTPSLNLVFRAWTVEDFAGAVMALGSIEDDEDAARFSAAARQAGVPVNVVDKPAFCDFQFGTIIERSPLVVAISTDGAAPVFGQRLRSRIEAVLPTTLRAWAQAAKDWRPSVQARNWPFHKRRRFWELFADLALMADGRAPTKADQQACFNAIEDQGDRATGRLVLVGAGQGDFGSVTFAAVEALQSADVVFVESRIATDVVALARREAKTVSVENRSEAYEQADRLFRAGKSVAWLGRCDPTVCPAWIDTIRAFKAIPEVRSVQGTICRSPGCGHACNDEASARTRPPTW